MKKKPTKKHKKDFEKEITEAVVDALFEEFAREARGYRQMCDARMEVEKIQSWRPRRHFKPIKRMHDWELLEEIFFMAIVIFILFIILSYGSL